MAQMIRLHFAYIWLFAVLPLSAMPEAEIPAETRQYGDLFLNEDEASAYAKIEAWIFDKANTDQETARRITVARDIIAKGGYVSARYSDHERWIDPLIAKINTDEGDNWLALREAARILDLPYLENSGVVIEGKFIRGMETGGPTKYSYERDRFHAIHYFLRAIALCKKSVDEGNAKPSDLAELYLDLADCLEDNNSSSIDFLTNLKKEPEFSTRYIGGWSDDSDNTLVEGRSSVLDANNNIRLPATPVSFEQATSDIARQRWLIDEAARISPSHRPAAQLKLAELWWMRLDVDQLCNSGYIYIEGSESELDPNAPGELELHTLKSDQTILITPAGLKRVTIPPEFRFIDILENLIADPQTPREELIDAYWQLIEIYSNRRQFDRGEQLALNLKKRFSDDKDMLSIADDFLREIKADGQFITSGPFVSGREIKVNFNSRNMDQLNLELWHLDVEKALSHNSPGEIFRYHHLEDDDQNQNLKNDNSNVLSSYYKKIRQWTSPLEKRPRHLQSLSQISIEPLEAGSYMLVARGGGETSGLAIQVEDTLLIGTKIDQEKANYLLLDTKTGKPVTNAEIIPHQSESSGSYFPDHMGVFSTDDYHAYLLIRRPGHPPEIKEQVYASMDDGDPSAHLEIETFFITNQPLYRPGQTVNFSCWVRQPGNRWFNAPAVYLDTKIRMKVTEPTGSVFYTETYGLDEFGAFSGSFKIDPDISLGSCEISLESMGSLSNPPSADGDPFASESWGNLDTWRIEVGEFRKPDFRVELEAGEKSTKGEVEVIVSANYNSGEPLMGSEIIAELVAYPTYGTPFPKSEFEKEYEMGYDWPLPESRWMPDWNIWGIRHSLLLGEYDDLQFHSSGIRQEITAITGEDGKARLVFPDKLPRLGQISYHCEIRAVVKEISGRTMSGELVFTEGGLSKSLFIRPGKGFYKTGEEITLTLNAMDSEREPISTTGNLRVERLTFGKEDRAPKYGKVLDRSVSFGVEGQTTVSFAPQEPGQYLCMFTSGDARRGIIINVLSDEYEARDLRFNPIQLTPRNSVCTTGDTVEVAIHSDKPDALVWLFQIMPNGRGKTPRMIQMRGKVAIVEFDVPINGTPNFQLLAMTFADGTVHHGRCQISVPPIENILALELSSAPEKPKPGDSVNLSLDVRDHLGKPTRASFAITAYDRSLEDLSEPLPKTRTLLLYSFEPFSGENPLQISNRYEDSDRDAFQQLWEPGCFSDRFGIVGEVIRTKQSRFTKLEDELFIAYEPPEVPQNIGGGGIGGAAFPVTPASPSTYTYRRPSANRIELEKNASDLLKSTKARSNFADYAHWGAAVSTDAQGHAKISFPLPDNLTAWKAQAWAFGHSNRFGDAELEITASKPLQIRPTIPRSAVHGDKLEISATIQNLSDKTAEFHLLLEVQNLETNLLGGKAETKSVTIPAKGEGIVTWPVELRAAGTANFRFLARSTDGSLSDGTELPLIVAPRTSPFVVAASETLNDKKADGKMNLDLSKLPDQATLRLRFSSQSSIDAIGAVPILAEYPFGCVEQTLNRFLPLLIASSKFKNTGGDWNALMKNVVTPDDSLGWIRARPLFHVEEASEPLTLEKSEVLIRAGLKRLDDMANDNSNDAWAWFKGGEPSPYLTALAIRGFEVARRSGYVFKQGGEPVQLISTSWLESHAEKRAAAMHAPKSNIEPEDAFIVYVLYLTGEKKHLPLQEILLNNTDKLVLSSRIFLALSLDPKEQADALAKLLPSIHKEMLRKDDISNNYQAWWEDSTETRAWYLMLLTHIDPGDSRIPEQVERLLAMRTNGLVWKSTRDTALCIEAIVGTISPFDIGTENIPIEIEIAGKSHKTTLKSDDFWTQELNIPITRDQLVNGQLPIIIRRQGTSKAIVRASATVRFDTDAIEHLTASSNGLSIERSLYLIRNNMQPLPLEDGAEITAGDLIEVEIKINSPLPRDFVHISDPIPAGLEPIHQLSGQEYGAYRETRLGETHLFIQDLGSWNDTFRYRCQAVTPGTSHALPTRAECMYAPAIFGSTSSAKLTILPRPVR